MARRGTLLALLAIGLVWALAARGQEPEDRDGDGIADPDTSVVQLDAFQQQQIAKALADSIASANAGADAPFFISLRNTPSVGIQAGVIQVRTFADLQNIFTFRQGSSLRDRVGYSFESYRRQDKTVERRGSGLAYDSGTQLPVKLTATADWDWSEDITINRGGLRNLDKRDEKRASVSFGRGNMIVAGVKHTLQVAANAISRRAVNQDQRSDLDEGAINGTWRANRDVVQGVTVAARLFAAKRDGESALGRFTNPTSTTSDTLGGSVFYNRSLLRGSFQVYDTVSDRRYLDFRRNANGIIDTLFVPAGESKVVQELEQKDAVSVAWDNNVQLGRLKAGAFVTHDLATEDYRFSQVGYRERLKDEAKFSLSFPVRRDSLSLRYEYSWSWDDQLIQGGDIKRGRQYIKNRQLSLNWQRRVFSNSRLTGLFVTGLAQETAENQFNQNDRDRVTGDASLKLDTDWTRLRTSLVFQYRSTEDINLRATKSSNNSFRETYEVAPTYTWPVAKWLSINQAFKVYIQYQDYTFGHLEAINKKDNYNKRGQVTTTLNLDPTSRLHVTTKYDYGSRFNATQTRTDATGNAFYRRDQEQFTSRVDLSFKYNVSPWLALDAATYRARDIMESLGNATTQTVTYSGELVVGAAVSKTWSGDNPVILAGKVQKHQAYGPNVTDTSRDYWDADVSLRWEF